MNCLEIWRSLECSVRVSRFLWVELFIQLNRKWIDRKFIIVHQFGCLILSILKRIDKRYSFINLIEGISIAKKMVRSWIFVRSLSIFFIFSTTCFFIINIFDDFVSIDG